MTCTSMSTRAKRTVTFATRTFLSAVTCACQTAEVVQLSEKFDGVPAGVLGLIHHHGQDSLGLEEAAENGRNFVGAVLVKV